MAKNNNIVGQGLAPAVSFGIILLKKRANTVRPYDWVFINVLKSAPQQTPPLPKGRGTVEDGGGILEFNDRQKPKNPPVTFGDSPL